ncbi:hypothetical protein PAXRUDRAFT_210767 [Paxillus rubicundulus Ve08.2h10]|uniref:Uncharacterized protein n=1 Tax=Paxillus rubicundulus Ve08.2h10 TaxID=930991 RepID=A0A0D0E1C8_9AGAM|nr:hypothetical protein PAXRUDRAFT_210767 [Paxillus rubicundulus Ve08.2h10]
MSNPTVRQLSWLLDEFLNVVILFTTHGDRHHPANPELRPGGHPRLREDPVGHRGRGHYMGSIHIVPPSPVCLRAFVCGAPELTCPRIVAIVTCNRASCNVVVGSPLGDVCGGKYGGEDGHGFDQVTGGSPGGTESRQSFETSAGWIFKSLVNTRGCGMAPEFHCPNDIRNRRGSPFTV